MITRERIGAIDEVHRRELEFHDALSSPLVASSMPPGNPDDLERELLRKAGRVDGLDVLELGCGTGDLTLQLLARGARVTALDLSPGMVAITRERVDRFAGGDQGAFVVAPVERTGLASGRFDLIVGKWILHHSDIARSVEEISRILRPGGRAIFVENSAGNPFLAFARRYLAGRYGIPRYGTVDEHPLTSKDYAIFARRFSRIELFFPDFCCFQLLDRQILRFRYPWLSMLFRGIDRAGAALQLLRRYSYHVILEASST
jgi:ubiquinone/menaquinone biosynthesis C-methylase UbiE